MYVVFGATGQTGSAVAATLLEKGLPVRVVLRSFFEIDLFLGLLLIPAPPQPMATCYAGRHRLAANGYCQAFGAFTTGFKFDGRVA